MTKRVLLVGESWNTYAVHSKGNAGYTTAGYEEGADQLIGVLREAGKTVDYMPNHLVTEEFPYQVDALSAYDTIILSDVPADSFLLPRAVFVDGERRPNRLSAIAEYVRRGGGLLMIGGYMSFSGFEGRARFPLTPLADVLPVTMLGHDDRIETPEGVEPSITTEHPVLTGIPQDWPYFLGYNRVVSKPGATTVLSVGDDPFLSVQHLGSGRTAAFASDCSPHWGSPAFMAWSAYAPFWNQLVDWTSGSSPTSSASEDATPSVVEASQRS